MNNHMLLRIAALSVLGMVCLTFGTSRASAAQLIWDAGNTNNGAIVDPASGNWDTTSGNTVWNNGSGDVAWTQTSTTAALNGAVFGGADGAWSISIDAGQVAVTNLAINNSGYTFSGNPIYLVTGDFLTVADGKAVTFGCNITGANNGAQYWPIGNGSIVNMVGNIGPGTTQVRLAGPATSAFYLGGTNTPSIMYVLSPVYMTNGSSTISSTLYIGYAQTLPAPNSTTYSTGILTISNATLTANGNVLIVGRNNGNGTLTIGNGAVVNVGVTAARPLAICYDGASSSGTVNVYGGILTVGSASLTGSTSAIDFFDTGETAASTAVMTQTNGVVFAWGGILFGAPSGTAGSATLVNSGGSLYLGKNGISVNAVPPSINIMLSGGTVGALANWSSSLPMTLGNTNGNITFQCADNNNNPFNISLSGALTGTGGLNLTGGGTLTLNGSNNYAGSTVVSNGTLAIGTSSFPTNGPVTLDGSTGSSTVTIQSSPGQYWSSGTLAFTSGTPTMNFQFGALSPSVSVAPVQVRGNLVFTATPNVDVGGSAIAVGTYPLITYTGAVSGTVPNSATVTLSGGSASGYITNVTASKTIVLVVTSSTYNPAFYWRAGNGIWDINTTSNWTQFGNPAKYVDGNAVIFDDTASGSSPIAVTLNTIVNPLAVTANNTAKNYIITGTGSIAGSGNLQVLGGGTVTLTGTNGYSGGTIISAGQLNINNGGTAAASAIGTGPLTLNSGAVIDNTSGSDVTLQASNPENWNGNFTYRGSANNFNTGAGSVTMNANTTLTVSSNNFIVGGSILDGGLNFLLTKAGNGALTLPVGNNFGGGLTLGSGVLNLGDPNAAGQGVLTINGGAIDNISGAGMFLTPASFIWAGNFSFLGTAELALAGNVVVPVGPGSVILNVITNTLSTYGDIISGNTLVIKSGAGTWNITGAGTSAHNLGLMVNAGQVTLNKSSGQAIGLGTIGLTVQANGLVVDSNSFQIHSDTLTTPVPVALSGGVLDLNGHNENMDKLSISGGGTLRNSASGSTSTLTLISGFMATLSGTNCQFDVVAVDGALNIKGVIAGSGSLVKTGLGVLNLLSNNLYTGNTVIGNGTLALPGAGSISNTAGINLATANSALDLSGNTDTNGNPTPVLTLQNGQTLSGFGAVTGLVATVDGATVAPGSTSRVGILTVTGVPGANTLGGTTLMKLNKGVHTNDQLSVSGSLVYGGTLALTNLSDSLAAGDSFALFSAVGGYSGTFASISPSRPGYPGFGLAWNTNNLATNGTLSIVTAPIPAPPSITGVSLSGATLSIQGTNGVANEPFVLLESANVAVGLTNWVPVATNAFDGSGNFNVSVGVTNITPQEFFRLSVQ